MEQGQRKKRGACKPRKPTPKRIENWALHHLARYDCSAAHLERLLKRRVDRSARVHELDEEECASASQAITDVIEKLLANGMLDDRRHAGTRAISLNRRGTSRRVIRGKLREKGIAGDLIEEALEALGPEGLTEAGAALALAKRRRLGLHRAPDTRQATREKDLAAMARAGFVYSLAQRIIDAETDEELEPDDLI
ncbi:MAG: RecX family transcriptional regulator [Rhodospirillales bacterium]|nr:RecX family transcriptional regulator [Rhodospirillales bacterium]